MRGKNGNTYTIKRKLEKEKKKARNCQDGRQAENINSAVEKEASPTTALAEIIIQFTQESAWGNLSSGTVYIEPRFTIRATR